ncbi:hypothetical protein D9758_001660 [Tetrapyrgos nigripes]|uniref:F-box domain-containing protein n=1 Tax=Tetrapyrgos nigripes TaxID=182062 RepID=A0A8H5GXM6_9AGAR|nr:hypothetical protein D9758_001660 [Tetrapyrgos nigripes]
MPSKSQAEVENDMLCSSCSIPIPAFHDPDCSLNTSQLRSTYSPSNSEVVSLLSSIQSFSHQIEIYKEQIARLRTWTRFLEDETRKAQKAKNRKHALLAPIRRLPAETLGDIFTIYCTDEIERMKEKGLPSRSKHFRRSRSHPHNAYTGHHSGSIAVPSLTLARVCSLWRSVALNNPNLWPNIHVQLEDISFKDLDLLSMALRLSKGTSLTVDARAVYGGIKEQRSRARKGFGMLLEYGNRWKEAKVRVGWANIIEMMELGYGDREREHTFEEQEELLHSFDFSRLELLDLSLDFSPGDQDLYEHQGNICSQVFSSAVNLRRLTLHENPGILSNLPLTGLTSLTLHSFDHEYIRVLDRCPNLQELDLSWYQYWRDPPSDDFPTTTSTSLTRLKMSNSNLDHALYIFHFLCVPNLESLELYAHPLSYDVVFNTPSITSIAPLAYMLTRSKPPLKEFVLGNVFFALDEVIGQLSESGERTGGILRLVPHLTRLEMPMSSVDSSIFNCEAFVRQLVIQADVSTQASSSSAANPYLPLVPKLAKLSLSMRKMMNVEVLTSICDMLESRLSFTSFKMTVDRGWHDDAVPQIRRFSDIASTKMRDCAGSSRDWKIDPDAGFCLEWVDRDSYGAVCEKTRLDVFCAVETDGKDGDSWNELLAGWDPEFCGASRELRLGWEMDILD